MRLIKDEEEEKELPAPKEPPALDLPTAEEPATATRVETHRTSPPLIRWIIAGVIIVIIAFLILLLVRWIYHKAHHHAEPGVGTTGQQQGAGTGASPQSGAAPAGGSSGSNSNSSPSTGNTNTGAGANKLPNNGPGNVAAVFAISSAAGTVLHYTIRTKRTSNG